MQPVADGTGGAVRAAADHLGDGTVLVLSGDVPLVTAEAIAELVAAHERSGAAGHAGDDDARRPVGLRARRARRRRLRRARRRDEGRRRRDARGAGDPRGQHRRLRLRRRPAARGARAARRPTTPRASSTCPTCSATCEPRRARTSLDDPTLLLGVNDRVDLARSCARTPSARINRGHMRAGVTIVDPATTLIDVDVAHRGRHDDRALDVPARRDRGRGGLHDRAADHARSTPSSATGRASCTPTSSAPRCGPGATVGPFAYLRPGHRPARAARRPARSSRSRTPTSARAPRCPHLSYIGDADVGPGTNLGAATITANYDGRRKHRTTIGANVRTSVDTTLVAPVTVGDGAYTAADSAITEDVPPGALGDRPRAPAEHRGLRGAQVPPNGRPDRGVHSPSLMSVQVRPAMATSLPIDYDKRLMLFSGRANPELAGRDRREARRRSRAGHAEDLLQRRGLLPLRGVDPRRRRLHHPADVRQPATGASARTTR